MNKNIILSVGAIIILILGIGGYILTNRHGATDDTSTQGTDQDQMMATEGTKSLKDLYASGTPQTCTFDTGENSSGTVYIGSGKMRGDFDTTVSDKTTMTHMISDGQTSFMWIDGSKEGFKSSFNATPASASPSATATNSQGVDLNSKVSYNCAPWNVDNAKFTLPSDVTFNDMNAMMPSPGSMMRTNDATESGSNSARCAACNTAPAGYKEQCLQSLGCI